MSIITLQWQHKLPYVLTMWRKKSKLNAILYLWYSYLETISSKQSISEWYVRSSGNWYKERTRLNSGNQQETFVQLNSELAMVVWNGIIETSMGSIRTPEIPRPSKLEHWISQLTVWTDTYCKFYPNCSKYLKDELNRIIVGNIVFVFFEVNYHFFFIFGFFQWIISKAFGLDF